MKIRIRGPTGQSTHSFSDSATIGELQNAIIEQTTLQSFDIKYGYPPKPLDLGGFDKATTLTDLELRLDGEQLIVSQSLQTPLEPVPAPVHEEAAHPKFSTNNANNAHPRLSQEASSSRQYSTFSSNNFGKSASSPSVKSQKSLSMTRKQQSKGMDPPEIPVPTHGATMALRVMPDDNSCLFRAFNTAFLGDMDNVVELRSIIAQSIQSNPNTYSEVVLDQKPDDYCRWIQTPDAWGGSIELGILSNHFGIEICSIDVKTLRVDRYNEGMAKRCVLVYSGIHYDTIALSPSDPPHVKALAPPEYDTKVFDAVDHVVLKTAVTLCTVLRDQHYYTDTAGFTLKCNDCEFTAKGQIEAAEHAQETKHKGFDEA